MKLNSAIDASPINMAFRVLKTDENRLHIHDGTHGHTYTCSLDRDEMKHVRNAKLSLTDWGPIEGALFEKLSPMLVKNGLLTEAKVTEPFDLDLIERKLTEKLELIAQIKELLKKLCEK